MGANWRHGVGDVEGVVVMEPLEQAISKCYAVVGPDDWQVAATCHGLIIGYHERWQDEQSAIEVVEIEKAYQSPLVNIDTGRSSRTFTTAGKIDKLASDPKGLILIDHKTTSQDISDPTGPYWRQLAVDSQASHYELLLLANGIRLDGIVWDVTRKPGIKPKQVAAKVRKEILELSHYCGTELTSETLEYLHATEKPRENGELYAARLAAETIENPDRYFGRRSNPRTREQLAEYATELWGTAGQIRDARRLDQHYRNSGACFNYGTPCRFLGLCSGTDEPESTNWQSKPKKNAELPDWIGGSDVLTNSRLRCFQTCRRKHFYEYELGIERVDAERREALHFGSAWHDVLDTYWQAFNEREANGDSNKQPVSCTGSQQTQLA